MVRFLCVSLCVIDFTVPHSFFSLSVRLLLHSLSWPAQCVSNRMLKCGNKHRNFASWRQTINRGEKMLNFMAISINRQRGACSAYGFKGTEHHHSLWLFFLPFYHCKVLLQSVCDSHSAVTLPCSFSKSVVNLQYNYAIHQQCWFE